MTLRVAIAEDDRTYRESLQVVLDMHPGFTCAGVFPDGQRLVEAAEAEPGWDVVLTDIEMPEMDGIEATRRLKARHADLPVVILTVFEDPPTVIRAICAGADGYVLKDTSPVDLYTHLQVAAAGGSPLTPAIAGAVLTVLRHAHADTPTLDVSLSRREREVLHGLVRGQSYKQVAGELHVSVDTVRTYIRSLYRKLQVHSVAEAVAKAVRHHLV